MKYTEYTNISYMIPDMVQPAADYRDVGIANVHYSGCKSQEIIILILNNIFATILNFNFITII